ncbi:MAG: hypothetical protein AAF802_06530 [Planctomycetota bacterium]
MESSEPAAKNNESVFPLPLAPMEHFLLLDDRQDCPLTSFIELHFEGELELEPLRVAIHRCLQRHPLLASRVEYDRGFPQWRFDPDFMPALQDMSRSSVLETKDARGTPRLRPFDLAVEPGCRFWFDLKPSKSRLILQLHHAVCDGIGIRSFLIDLLAEYARSSGATVSSPRYTPDSDRLLGRADFSAVEQSPPKIKLRWWEKLRNTYYFYLQRPHPLGGLDKHSRSEAMSAGASNNEPLLHQVFDKDSSLAIESRCKREGVRLNDLALAVLFRSCHRWNQESGTDSGKTRIRLLMPVDLRRRSDLRLPAANRLSFAFLGRTHEQCESWESLLKSVQVETQRIKDTRVYMDFLKGLQSLSNSPQRFRRAIDANRNMSTAVLTYSGDIARGMKSLFPKSGSNRQIGRVSLSKVLAAPPARENTNIALGVCSNWGQICISMNWSRNVFSPVDAKAFLDSFTSVLNDWGAGKL